MNSLELLILDLVWLIYNPTYMVWEREREREREREETYWYDIGIIDVVKMKNEYNVLKKNH